MDKKSCPPGQTFSKDLGRCTDALCSLTPSNMSLDQINDVIQENERVQEM